MGTSDAKGCTTPISTSEVMSKSIGTLLDDGTQYRTVGALHYTTMTHLDITFVVNKLCQYMHSPTDVHWKAVKRLLRYLLATISHGLFFTPESTLQLQYFSDSDWGGCNDDCRSTNSYVVYMGTHLIS